MAEPAPYTRSPTMSPSRYPGRNGHTYQVDMSLYDVAIAFAGLKQVESALWWV